MDDQILRLPLRRDPSRSQFVCSSVAIKFSGQGWDFSSRNRAHPLHAFWAIIHAPSPFFIIVSYIAQQDTKVNEIGR